MIEWNPDSIFPTSEFPPGRFSIRKMKRRIFKIWTPRFGVEAAEIRWRASVYTLCSLLFLPISVVLIVLGAASNSAPLLLSGVFIVGVFFFVGVVLPIKQLQKAYRHIGNQFGIDATGRNAPPTAEQNYLVWCTNNGLTPNPFGERLHQ